MGPGDNTKIRSVKSDIIFLAPIGAQERLMLVRAFGPSLSRAVNLHHSGSNLQAISRE